MSCSSSGSSCVVTVSLTYRHVRHHSVVEPAVTAVRTNDIFVAEELFVFYFVAVVFEKGLRIAVERFGISDGDLRAFSTAKQQR